MCFSASASFGAGVVLTAIGVVSIKKVQHPSQLFFACIPLIFAIQQITEGFLWLALPDIEDTSIQKGLTYVFLFMAQVVWPLWVPVSILLLEKKSGRNRVQKILVGIGILISFYLGYCLVSYPVLAKIIGHHISYKQDYPGALSNAGALLYIIATIVPPFFHTLKECGFWELQF